MIRPELPPYLLAVVAIAAAVILEVTGHPEPPWLSLIAVGGLAGGTGVTHPAGDHPAVDVVAAPPVTAKPGAAAAAPVASAVPVNTS